MKECNCDLRDGDAKTAVFGSNEMLQPAPVDTIPMEPTTPQIAYQMVKDETFAQTQPRLNLATFVTTYMDDYATKLMNEAISINYIDETEYPRIAVMNAKCINIMANLWNSPEQAKWKTGALAIGSSEACMLGGVAAWLRWKDRRKAQGKPTDKPNFVISSGFQVVWEKFAQLWQIEMRQVPLTLDKTTLDPEEALKMCDENTICIVPIAGVTWTGLDDDIEGLDEDLAKYKPDSELTIDSILNGYKFEDENDPLLLDALAKINDRIAQNEDASDDEKVAFTAKEYMTAQKAAFNSLTRSVENNYYGWSMEQFLDYQIRSTVFNRLARENRNRRRGTAAYTFQTD